MFFKAITKFQTHGKFVQQHKRYFQRFTNVLCNNPNPKTATATAPGKEKILINREHPVIPKTLGITLSEMLRAGFENNPSKNSIAFECGVTGEKLSFEDVFKHSKGFSSSLLKLGLKRGDTIGIVLPNTLHFTSILIGIWDVGMIASPVNPAYHPEEMLRQIRDSDSKCVITIPEFLPIVKKFQHTLPALKHIIVTGGEPQADCHSYREMIKDTSDVTFIKGSEIDTDNELAMLLYSSGTSGLPKGVMLTHSSVGSLIDQVLIPGYLSFNPEGEDRLVAVLPFFHSYGLFTFSLIGMLRRAHTLTLPKFEPKLFNTAIRNHKPTLVHLVPPLIHYLVMSPEITSSDLAYAHTVVGGAAPVGPFIITKLLEKAGKYIFFQELYGMTELSPGSHILKPDTKNTKIGSCGTLIAGTSAKVISVDDPSKTLGPNERGELCVKGPQVMKGYWKNEQATNETIDSDGWLRTGDIAYYDTEDHFYIVDRLKELIKVKGFQVAPAELEELLRKHPDVLDAAVIGIPHEQWGEVPRGYIVPKNPNLTESDLHNYLKDHVADFKQLVGGIEFKQAIPKAPSGKILRRELKAEFLGKTQS